MDGGISRTDTAYWKYQAQNLPASIKSSKLDRDPPPITVNAAVFYNAWIWRIEKPKTLGGIFATSCAFKPTYGGILSKTTLYDMMSSHTIKLTPPPREKQPTP